MHRQRALAAGLCLALVIGVTACGDGGGGNGAPIRSPTPTATPSATPSPPLGNEPFSCVVANCGPDVTCAALGFVDPLKHCYLFDGQYLCCRESPFG